MPAKRISVKGQGADLFFGNGQQARADAPRDDTSLEQGPADSADTPTSASTEVSPAPASATLLQRDDLPPDDAAPSSGRDIASLPDRATAPETADEPDVTDEPSRYHASQLASTDAGIEAIRRVVKQIGREVSFVRLSAEEKGRLADIVYTYRRQGRKTTENELNRIAINALLDDYDAHGAQSVLARVLDALHA